jgi:chemotaxis signal transduction protein
MTDAHLLEARAARLATPVLEPEASQALIVFAAASGERYAAPLKRVRGVIRESVTPVPGVARWMAGLVNVRGHLRSVVDLNVAFGHAADSEATGDVCVVLLESRFGEVGVIAHDVPVLVQVRVAALQLALPGQRGVAALVKDGGVTIALLDVDEWLDALDEGSA